MKKRFCRVCRVELKSDNWKSYLQEKRDYLCVDCWRINRRKQQREYLKANPKQRKNHNKRSSEYARTHPEKRKILMRAALCRQYGITSERFDELYDLQQGCCAICGIHQSGLKQTLSIDHDHKTGGVRGLLCNKCNLALGSLGDDVRVLQRAVDYLEGKK